MEQISKYWARRWQRFCENIQRHAGGTRKKGSFDKQHEVSDARNEATE